jgi:hypothetical protein
MMAALPNLNGKLRAVYFVLGLVAGGYGLYGTDVSWLRITLLAVGGALIVFAIIGFDPILWLFGVRGSAAE